MTPPRQPTRLDRLRHRWFLWRTFYKPWKQGLIVLLLVGALSSLIENAVIWWQDFHPQCAAVQVVAPHGASVNGKHVQPRDGVVAVRFCAPRLREDTP